MAEGGGEEIQTSEAVSVWTEDLSDLILVQRARVVNLQSQVETKESELKQKSRESLHEAQLKLESLESLLKEAIIAHTAEVEKLTKYNAARSIISEAKKKLESLISRLREAIVFQGARVRKLEGKSEKEEVVKRQETLIADYKAATGQEWSDVRDEGPIILTSNKVRGEEVREELKQRLKDLSEKKIIR